MIQFKIRVHILKHIYIIRLYYNSKIILFEIFDKFRIVVIFFFYFWNTLLLIIAWRQMIAVVQKAGISMEIFC